MKIGNYIGADLVFENNTMLNNLLVLTRKGTLAIKVAKFKLLNIQTTQYYPKGLTIVFVISQSHLTFHTYPEYNYMQLELSTCGNNSIDDMFNFLIRILKPRKVKKWKRIITVPK